MVAVQLSLLNPANTMGTHLLSAPYATKMPELSEIGLKQP